MSLAWSPHKWSVAFWEVWTAEETCGSGETPAESLQHCEGPHTVFLSELQEVATDKTGNQHLQDM